MCSNEGRNWGILIAVLVVVGFAVWVGFGITEIHCHYQHC